MNDKFFNIKTVLHGKLCQANFYFVCHAMCNDWLCHDEVTQIFFRGVKARENYFLDSLIKWRLENELGMFECLSSQMAQIKVIRICFDEWWLI